MSDDINFDTESDSVSEIDLDSHKSSESSESSEKTTKKTKKSKKTKKTKDLLMKLPALHILVKKALDNNINVFDRDGNPLSQIKLYQKLKILHVYDKVKEDKKRVFTTKLKKKNVDELLKLLEKKEETKKAMFRKDFFKKEEIKRYDFLFNLYHVDRINDKKVLEIMDDIDMKEEDDKEIKDLLEKVEKEKDEMTKFNLLNKIEMLKVGNDRIKEDQVFLEEIIPIRQRFVDLLLSVREDLRKDVIQKYIEQDNPLSFYSILLLHRCMGSTDTEKDILVMKQIEESLQTPEEKKRITTLALSMLKSGDVEEKIDNVQLLQEVLIDIPRLERLLEKEEKDDNITDLQKQIDSKKNQKDLLVKLLKKKNTFDQTDMIRQQISKLMGELMIPDDPEKKRQIDELKICIYYLSLDVFTLNKLESPDTIYGLYLVKDPFSSKLEKTEEIEMKEKVDIKKLKKYLENELELLKKVNEILSFEHCVEIKELKKEFLKKHPYVIMKTIRYMIGKVLRSKEAQQVIDLVQQMIELQKLIHDKSKIIIDDLSGKIQVLVDGCGFIEDQNKRLLINKLQELEKNIVESDKRVKYIDLEIDQFMVGGYTKESLEKQKENLVEKLRLYKGRNKQQLVDRIDKITQKLGEFDDEYVQFLSIKNRILSSPYNTESEIKLIDEMVKTFPFMEIEEFKKYKKLFSEELEVKFVNDEYFDLSKKRYKLQQKIDKNVPEEKVKILKQQISLLEEQMKTYDEDIIKNSREHYKRLKDLNDIISIKIDEFKDTMFDILKSRKEKVKQTFILPVNNCLPNYFKKPWINNYSGRFFVYFVGDIPEHCILKNKVVIDGITYHEGTRYLDILLCSKKQDDDMITINVNEKEYQLHVLYKVKDKFVRDNDISYSNEKKWKNKQSQTVENKIEEYLENTIKEVTRQFLSKYFTKKLSNYFEEKQCVFIVNKILDLFNDKDKVKDVVLRFGSLIIFLDPYYMKEEAKVFNKRLESGYVNYDQIIDFTPDLILFELYENMKLLTSNKKVSEIILAIRENRKIEFSIDEKFSNVIKELKELESLYQMQKIEKLEQKAIIVPRMMTLEENKRFIGEQAFIFQEEKRKMDELDKAKYIDDIQMIISKYPEFFDYCIEQLHILYDMGKVKVKVEQSLNEFLYKTVYDILLSRHVILHQEQLKPFQKIKVYKTLSKKDCTNDIPENDIVYYIEDGELYCFSIRKLIEEQIKFNEFTKKPFSEEFLFFLGLLKISKKEEQQKEQEDEELKDKLSLLYSEIILVDDLLLKNDPEFKDVYDQELLENKSLVNYYLFEAELRSITDSEFEESLKTLKKKESSTSSESESSSSESESTSSESESTSSESESESTLSE